MVRYTATKLEHRIRVALRWQWKQEDVGAAALWATGAHDRHGRFSARSLSLRCLNTYTLLLLVKRETFT
jgi:hypothetical protein